MRPHLPSKNSPQPWPRSHLTDSEISRILTFAYINWSTWDIVQIVGCGRSTVSHILRTYDCDSFVSWTRTRVCKWKTTKHEDRILTQCAKKHDYLAFHDIINLVTVKVSKSTLRRGLKEINLFSHIHCKKPYLTTKHKHDRLEWVLKHQNLMVEDQKCIIWSDESSIVLGRKSRRRRCLRKPGTAHLSRHCDKTVKSEKVTLMVWACFSGNKIGHLIPCDVGAINSDHYLSILMDGVVSFVEELFANKLDSDTIAVVTSHSYIYAW